MTPHRPFLRRLAVVLADHAVRIMPPRRLPWAEAMRNELSHIDSDRLALRWAAGSVAASYLEKIRGSLAIQRPGVRWLLALLLVWQAFGQFFAPALTLAYRLNRLGIATALGRFTPGDAYGRFIPLMDATPTWLLAIWMAAGLTCLASAWQILRNRSSAWWLFATACAAELLGQGIAHTLPAYQAAYAAAFTFPSWRLVRDGLIPAAQVLLPVLALAALWVHRCSVSTNRTGPCAKG